MHEAGVGPVMNSDIWWYGLLMALGLFQLVAIPALYFKKNDLADVLWGPAFFLTATGAHLLANTASQGELGLREVLVLSLIFIWGARLGYHVGRRNLSTRMEDVRYANWRAQWGRTQVWRSYLQVWVLQPLILFVFLVPVLNMLAWPSQPPGSLTYFGLAIWLVGFVFESLGDAQLAAFKAKPESKGRLMTTGLWSWTRHPNYFGEITMWWGIWLMVADLPGGWWTVLGPFGVTYLIWNVSGISMLEDLMRDRPGFREYAARTSKFFPRPPL